MSVDVAVVGAGIGGAVLGLALGRRGWRVAIVERESAPLPLPRPEVLWGATVSALEAFGMAGAISAQASVALDGIDIGAPSGPLFSITSHDLAAAKVRGFSTDPALTRALLLEAALATGCVEVHRGVKIDDLLRDSKRAVGVAGKRRDESFSIGARLVVGDDGVHSVVRTQLGIPLAFSSFPVDFITATIRWPEGLPPRKVHVRVDPAAFRAGLPAAGFFPRPRGEGVLLVPLSSERAESLFAGPDDVFWSSLEELTQRSTFLSAQLQFPRDFSRVRRPFGHAPRYVDDGAAILGDAAHPMTPAGGQGANAAIWDALALADVADSALRAGDPTRETLLAYERIRHPINGRSVAISARAARIFRLAGHLPLATVLPPLARLANRLDWPKRRLIRGFATTFVTPPRAGPPRPTRCRIGAPA